MDGDNGLWFAFPQIKDEENGEASYFEQMFLTSPERGHIRKLVLLDLQQQGHIENESSSGRHSMGQDDENIPF